MPTTSTFRSFARAPSGVSWTLVSVVVDAHAASAIARKVSVRDKPHLDSRSQGLGGPPSLTG
jgi:hypothetical protein